MIGIVIGVVIGAVVVVVVPKAFAWVAKQIASAKSKV
jgi:uncharacterized membrane-anchored protein YhcB (DUF1043 family)